MGSFCCHNFSVDINPPPVPGTQLGVSLSPLPLLQRGLNIPVEISTASIFRKLPNPHPLHSMLVMAHLDTGASITSISVDLAKHLNLMPIGQSDSFTAGGIQNMPNFAVDLTFPNTKLSSFLNLRIGSCYLQFDKNAGLKPTNFGILLGRDIMSHWHITWDGPTSTVFISD